MSMKVCICALGAFGYADNTHRLEFFIPDARRSVTTREFMAHITKTDLKRDLERLKECGIDISKLEVKRALIVYTLEKEKKPLRFDEDDTIRIALSDMDAILVSQLKECAEE